MKKEVFPQGYEFELNESSEHFSQLEKFILNNWDCGAADLTSKDALLESFAKLSDFDFSTLKDARWEKDSLIFLAKHKFSQKSYSIKVHENSFRTCRRNYQRHRSVLSSCPNVSLVHGAVKVVSATGKSYFVVIYNFVVGLTLDQALKRQMLTNEKAVDGLISLCLELKKIDFNVLFLDKTDFIFTVDAEIVITDWDKLFNTKSTNSEESITRKCNSFVSSMIFQE
ncbi:hypothetical protein [Parashewanella curva]|uniref:hypothetical protein n=1 Tax=Parashewanella curva TaxID=2338552 RepID=UPI0010599830|nr:hypothetical protein [Parashewanella curva]